MTRCLFAPLTATALLLGTAATAQISAADVWTNSNAPIRALGATITATPTTDGDTTTYADYAAAVVLPFGLGNVTLDLPTMALTENGDGTVSLTFPDGYDLGVAGRIGESGPFSATVEGEIGDVTMIASGTPGDITYESGDATLSMVLTEAMLDGAPVQGVSLGITATSEGGSTVMRIVEGDLVTMSVDTSTARSDVAFTYTVDGQASGETTTVTTGAASRFEVVLPAAGADIMNLAAALRDGLSLTGTNASLTSTTASVTKDSLGVVMSEQNTSQGATDAAFGFDTDGFVLTGTSRDFALELREQFLPFPISAAIAEVSANFRIPVMASPEPQEVIYAFTLGGITVADGLWGMIDPGQIFDRSPMTLQLGLSGEVVLTTDLLDVNAIMALGETGELPGTVPLARLDALVLEGLGARVTADGEWTVDWSQMATMGTPVPAGTLTFRAEGVNKAIQSLTEAGLVSPQDTMPVTFGLGIIGRPVGEDAYEGTLEITEDGQFLANGTPLQ